MLDVKTLLIVANKVGTVPQPLETRVRYPPHCRTRSQIVPSIVST